MRLTRVIYLTFILLISGTGAIRSQTYAESSVLSDGLWFKYTTARSGVIKLSYNELNAMGLPSGTMPAIYANNFGLLSYMNNDAYPDDLVALPVYVEKGDDGVFNPGDYILFYSASPHRWKYDETGGYAYFRHNYSDSASFFLSWNVPGTEMSTSDLQAAADMVSSWYDYIVIHEVEEDNLIKSGREWYEPISYLSPLLLNEIEHAGDNEEGEESTYKLRVFARSGNMTSFRLKSGDNILASLPVSGVDLSSSTGTYAREATINGSFDPAANPDPLSIEFHNNGDVNARAWIDYLIVNSRKKIVYQGEPLYIRDSKNIAEGSVTEYRIETNNDGLSVWDISDSYKPLEITTDYSGGIMSFRSESDSLHTFLVFDKNEVSGPGTDAKEIANQNLHAPAEYDGIILTHPLFREQAQELADIHMQKDGISSLVVTPREVYNEFSGGIPDISAIRNFVRMVYTRNKEGNKPLKYLTLFGDGSVNNRLNPPGNPNFIPTWQTRNSHINIQSYTSDDFYGLLDENEGESTGFIDIGIGRFPVTDTVQANNMISKTRRYLDPANMGAWRNMILMIADDEDSNTHLNDAEGLSTLLESEAPFINIDKVYFDSYEQITTINGESYPDVTEAINDRLKAGCLFFNYLGHGNELGLAHERVVKISDIDSWSNSDKLPVFITATCEFSRFDDITIEPGTGNISPKTSAGEMVLLSEKGGGIALMTTTRIVYSSPNYTLNNRIYRYAFTPGSDGRGLALGDIFRLAKNDAGTGDNKRNFTLLGDPALKLSYAWHGNVITDSINGIGVSAFNDTIKALSELTISGHIKDYKGQTISNLDGYINTIVFDKSYEVSTVANDGGTPVSFDRQDRSLFRGRSEVKDGKFEIKTFIPREIDYNYGEGKISFYISTDTSDYKGSYNDLIIGGFNDITVVDTTGPQIKLYLNDTLFRNGGLSDSSPTLLALLNDQGGINTSGTAIGHDIISYLDGDKENAVVLNNFFENDLNSYTRGTIEYPLGELLKGKHTLSLKAWDNYNNSSTSELVFIVESDKGFVLNRLINYPNPFVSDTRINLDHNRPGSELEINITIYNTGGALLKKIRSYQNTDGYSLDPIIWNGMDDGGSKVARGVYIYTVTIRTDQGEKASISGRMVIL